MTEQKIVCFTLDVEDGVSIAMRDIFGKNTEQTDRVVTYTKQIIELLGKHGVTGTFFVLGEVAKKFPDLLKAIAKADHEIGVHGYHHLQFFRMTPDEAFQELTSAKKLIEDLTGSEVAGHRAPAFSITPETEWGLDVIAKAGFIYDSSIMPVRGRRYGWPGFSKDITTIPTGYGNLIEVPMSVGSVFGKEMPVCGGGYLRLFPYRFTRRMIEQILQKRPAVVYMHPYELDTEPYPDYYFEELRKTDLLTQLRMRSMWINRKTIFSKLDDLLTQSNFVPMIHLVNEYIAGVETEGSTV
ncbi:polysaccharide deacetylase family protein [Rhodohalobacter mucosus]|uniref:Polysaccharide deacetylase family protein n=1 Tax=Rhodohalobacter mucosus TaxID=2079485 RepID=A0A316TT80_9BACT|nr:polysaccharide deacetylase family protein [Rhodohalobacter mucosus]PWN07797.1 polysaccharide deacetylase family protein [Rhodohalobacter mucosus]